jgi:hypothetical protein
MKGSSARRLHLLALTIALTAGAAHGFAKGRVYTARVFLDRALPERFVSVADFRINVTLSWLEAGSRWGPDRGAPMTRLYERGPMDARDVQHVILHSADGTFQIPFDTISEVVVNRSLGWFGDSARYDATVRLKQERESRSGRIEFRALRGTVDSIAWHVLLTARDDHGANLHRIVFVD